MKYYVGLDVSMKKTAVCIVNEDAKIVHESIVKTDPQELANAINKTGFKIELVGFESGALSHYLHAELKQRELPIVCIEARHMSVLLSTNVNKTDRNDARGIAKALRNGSFKRVHQKPHSSGEIHKQGHISKCGSKELRMLLTEAGMVVLMRSQKWSKVKAWGLKLMRKKGIKKAALAVGRKLAVIMHRMLVSGKEFIYGEEPLKKAA